MQKPNSTKYSLWLSYALVALVFLLLPLAAKADTGAGGQRWGTLTNVAAEGLAQSDTHGVGQGGAGGVGQGDAKKEAQGAAFQDGLRFYDKELKKFIQAPGIATYIKSEINGTVIRTQLVQYFFNNTNDWQEGIYSFPIPENASVDKLVMIVGDRRILGFVAEKKKAKKIYEKAKAEGKATGLVEQHRPNIFRTKIANIPPQSLVAVEIAYQSAVKINERQISMRLPMAITPRFDNFDAVDFLTLTSASKMRTFAHGEDSESLRLSERGADAEAENESQNESKAKHESEIELRSERYTNGGGSKGVERSGMADALAERIALFNFEDGNNPVRFEIVLDAGFDFRNLRSPSHGIETHKDKQGRTVIVPSQMILPGEQDFRLSWDMPDSKNPIVFAHQEKLEDAYYTHMMIVPPSLEDASKGASKDELQGAGAQKHALKRQVTFILDTSGSMSGPSIKQAKSALRQALYDLNSEDYFNVIQFNSVTEGLFIAPKRASQDTVKEALRWVSLLEAQGGTQMLPSIEMALAAEQRDGYLQQIVFITDGAVGYESALGRYVQRNAGRARIHVVGIGAAPNTHFMQGLARAGRGSATFVADVSETKAQMESLFRKMKTPLALDLRLSVTTKRGKVFSQDQMRAHEIDMVPVTLPDLMAGDIVRVSLKSPDPLKQIMVNGRKDGEDWALDTGAFGSQNAKGVSKIYARHKIEDLKMQRAQMDRELLRRAIVDLGVRHQIVSDETSLVAVDETRIRPENALLSSKRYHPNLPKGWGLAEYDPAQTAKDYMQMLDNAAKKNQAQNGKHRLNLPKTDTGYIPLLALALALMMIGLMTARYGR